MSKENTSETASQTTDHADTVEKPEKKLSLEMHRKLLDEKKKVQAELNELKAWKEEQDLAKKQAEGKHLEVIEALREENKKMKGKLNETTQNYAYSKFEDQIKLEASRQGCVNPDKLMRLLTKDQMKSVQMSDDFKVNSEDLNRLMENLKQEHQDIGLFKKKNVNVNNVTGEFKIESPNYKEMKTEDIINQLRSLK